ncbi:GNAT family N-acetyltransferase [Cohaesibacter haloalkalitolerans]|uniref:GNAT family N-acetyltransferase n=1 Tax=Cohaesibacter haloalkalitolerans TaxID=1162980 RepID=UPI000E64D961|nr:GNAT family protein [Cohaesibacter haloalkalitolerans]
MTVNQYGQPIGDALPDWSARPRPGDVVLKGQYCRLEPLDADRHGRDLYEAYATAPDGRDWTYMTGGPFLCRDGFDAYLRAAAQSPDPKHYAIIDLALGKAVATFSLMRIDPANGVIEVGNVAFSPLLKQKTAATEAQFLLMGYVFGDLGYRRYEWKCDSLNAPSRKAAERLGFSFEGIFRQAIIYKGRSRDTAWFSVIDKEWPLLKEAFELWLAADNFDAGNRQTRRLEDIRQVLVAKE